MPFFGSDWNDDFDDDSPIGISSSMKGYIGDDYYCTENNTMSNWLAQDTHALAELFVVRQFNSLYGIVEGVEPISWYSILIPDKTFKSRQEAVSESVNVLKRVASHRDFYTFMEEMRKYNASTESDIKNEQ